MASPSSLAGAVRRNWYRQERRGGCGDTAIGNQARRYQTCGSVPLIPSAVRSPDNRTYSALVICRITRITPDARKQDSARILSAGGMVDISSVSGIAGALLLRPTPH